MKIQMESVQRPKSEYRGLSWDRKHESWRVRIYYRSKQRHIGRYTDEIEAARAYDKAAYYLYGDAAITNFGVEAVRQDGTEVSAFIVQAKQQAHASDHRQGPTLHLSRSGRTALQQIGVHAMQQQLNLHAICNPVSWHPQQLHHNLLTSGHRASVAAASPAAVNNVFHGSNSFSNVPSTTLDYNTLRYTNSASGATTFASTQEHSTSAPGFLQPAAPKAAASIDAWFNTIDSLQTVGSVGNQNSAYTISSASPLHCQEQYIMPAATANSFSTSASLPTGQFVSSMPLPAQQQLQMSRSAGPAVMQAQGLLCTSSAGAAPGPIQQKQLITASGQLGLNVLETTMAGPAPQNTLQQQQLLRQQLCSLSLAQDKALVPASDHSQLFSSHLYNMTDARNGGASVQTLYAAGAGNAPAYRHCQTVSPQVQSMNDASSAASAASAGSAADHIAALLAGAGPSALSSPFAAAMMLEEEQQQTPQDNACNRLLLDVVLCSAQSHCYDYSLSSAGAPAAAVTVVTGTRQAGSLFN